MRWYALYTQDAYLAKCGRKSFLIFFFFYSAILCRPTIGRPTEDVNGNEFRFCVNSIE